VLAFPKPLCPKPFPSAQTQAVFSGHVFEGRHGGVCPRQQLIDLAVGMTVDNFGDDVGEIAVRFDTAELAGLNQRSNDCPALATAVGTGEERILAVQRDRPD
jgi:hypothetical protein